MTLPVTFTLDLEDHRPRPDAWPARHGTITRDLLGWLDGLGVRATVFVVGEVADDQRALVADIAAAGHEVGLHGWTHTPLDRLDPDAVAADVRRGRALLEDLTGAAVTGFRAPTFSLVPATPWVPDILAEAGFRYSSSVLPAANPLYGWPGAPRHPFRWPSGLVELPAPVGRVGPIVVPFLGGTYLRVLPWPVVSALLARSEVGPAPWTYCHAYDFDAGEPYWVVPEAGRWGSPLLWVGRRRLRAKLERLLGRAGAGEPLGVVAERFGDAAEFRPPPVVAA